jgi:hypothetical protein
VVECGCLENNYPRKWIEGSNPSPSAKMYNKGMYTFLITIWGLLNAVLSAISVAKIRKNKDKCDFIYWWGFLSGAFVWEDMFVFGILHALLVFVTIVVFQNPIFWLISFLTFWVVRSFGETLYFFLQQFILPQHHPHKISAHFVILKRFFGDISEQKCFILMQITLQSVTVICLLGLFYVFRFCV